MIKFAIFVGSLLATGALGALSPVGVWWRSLLARGTAAIVIILAFTVPFLGGRGGPDASDILSTAGTARLTRLGVLIFLFLVCLNSIIRDSRCLRNAGGAAIGMLLYALFAVFSATYSVSPLVSALKGFEVLVLVMVGLYLAGQLRVVADLQWLLDVLSLVMLFFVVSALMGLVIVPGEAIAKLQLSSAIVVQGVAPVINANTLTQFSALLALLCMSYVLVRGWRRAGSSVWIVFAIALTTMLLAHSRTSIVAAVIALVGMVFFSGRKAAALAVAGVGAIAWFFMEVVATYILRGQSEQVFRSLSGRTFFWEGVWEHFLESPIVGHGFYAAQRVLLGTSTVDNTYLEVLIGLGIVGVLAFSIPVLLTAYGLLRTIPVRRTPPIMTAIWLQLFVLMVLLLVRSLTGPSFQVMHPNLVMFMILAIGVAALKRFARAPVAVRQRDAGVVEVDGEEAGDSRGHTGTSKVSGHSAPLPGVTK